jgi:CelD/BcsL family acetyltransferase involved in cellulose biosynthesis
MNVAVVTSREDLAPIRERWDELAWLDSRDGFFRTSAWYLAWMQHIRPDAAPFVVVVRDDGGRIVGLAPLCRGTYRDLIFRLKAVFWAGREVVSGDFLDFLADAEARSEVIPAMLRFLEQNRSCWNLLVLGELLDGGHSYAALERMATQCDLGLRRQEERTCPYIALPTTFDQYLANLGSSTRYHIRRRMRDIERKGASVEAYDQPEEVASLLDTLIHLHLGRWGKENLPGTMGRPGFAAFLRDILANSPPPARCRLYVLRYEGSAAAALLTFYWKQSALYYQAGWDPNSGIASLSPGVVLMAHSLRDSIQNGLQFYEFLRGDEAYKFHWTKTHRTVATLLLAGSFTAKQYFRVLRWKDFLKHQLMTRTPVGIRETNLACSPDKIAGG